ncbi:TAXI family TRAP transporter solute-binding subunit [Nisaea acidiphila]|uniref:TAXI family TRAP transporter solute-binding subunit n=1 Tax=Nisaea acidiphila TaxID=1862145 RepID=A0A9J7AV10_9PROT|nr:TAXI family TRAP transporter solute-binding subunit [Nisaea acidiphila]UUX50642.1 TAXI family TRAP transporter solute-binding subunit [Nisaea acidiphila]
MGISLHSIRRAALAGAVLSVALGGTALADANLPKQLAWTAYGTGTAGYNQSVAIGGALKSKLGVNLRVLPGKNDVSRTEPLRQNKVQFSATGVGASFMAQEGAFDFGAKRWGPQKIRTLMMNNGAIGLAVGVAGDIGVKEYSDLKGKRVAWVKGSPSLNVNTEAYLAYGGLTWDDVEKVEFGGFGASWAGMVNGQVDAAFASTSSGKAYEMEASPRGLLWPPIDAGNKAGLDRMSGIAPFFQPTMASVGATIKKESPVPTAAYPYPVLVAYPEQEEDLVYNMTKAMVELFDDYAGKAPGINGWALDKQNLKWVVPYHAGAVRYYKEIGKWGAEEQAHNDKLIERQEVLATAWKDFLAKGASDDAWNAEWRAARHAALKAKGFNAVF